MGFFLCNKTKLVFIMIILFKEQQTSLWSGSINQIRPDHTRPKNIIKKSKYNPYKQTEHNTTSIRLRPNLFYYININIAPLNL